MRGIPEVPFPSNTAWYSYLSLNVSSSSLAAKIGTLPASKGTVMRVMLVSFPRIGALLSVNLLFLLMWGFAAIGKVRGGMPSWFSSKFGETILARFPGLPLSFWLLTGAELLALLLGAIALIRFEFLGRCRPTFLTATL